MSNWDRIQNVRGCALGSNREVYKRLYSIESYRVYLRGVYLLVRERLHRVSERVVWAPLRPRTDAGLQSKTWRLLLDRDSIEELSKGRLARYNTPLLRVVLRRLFETPLGGGPRCLAQPP